MSRRKRIPVEEWVDYRFRPTVWYPSHSAWWSDGPVDVEKEHKGSLDITLLVALVEPIKGVCHGELQVISDHVPEQWGTGLFNYHSESGSDERMFSGAVWTSEVGVLGLLMLLMGERPVELFARGTIFKYRKAMVRSFGWAVVDHPDLADM